MPFEVIDSLSIPGDPAKANDDAFAVEKNAAVVFDGATGLGENLLPGPSDAAWIAHFGARRLMAHIQGGDAPDQALRQTLAETEKSFIGLRRRPPKEKYEIPCASMMLISAVDTGFEAMWFGDCGALVLRSGEPVEIVGETFDKRAAEANRAAALSKEKGIAPAAGLSRAEFLPHIRASRNKVNAGKSGWLFSPDSRAADHVASKRFAAPAGSLVFLASDGFLALASDYDAYSAQGLVEAARDKGLKALGEELRALEADDREGRRFPRFKISDDATAVLLKSM
jgi:hypothetical protein